MWTIVFWIALILASWYYIYRSRSNYPLYFLFGTYLLKIFSGLLIGLYYLSIKEGQGDTFLYFNQSLRILDGGINDVYSFIFKNELSQNLDTPRTVFFIKILIPIAWISAKNYWLTVILLANISYLSLLILLTRSLCEKNSAVILKPRWLLRQ